MRLKRLCPALVAVILLSVISINSFAASSCSWFIKRKGNSTPQFPKEADIISQYDAYFIDQKAIECNEKKLYLTFDAGYENGNVERILDILKEKQVPAAFFLLDNIILKNTDLVIRMADEGHLVCNHTKNHKDLSFASEEEIGRNLTALNMIYEEKTGREMARYFRFPEGKYSVEALKCVQKLGYKTIFWSFAYDDWDNARQSNPNKAIKKVLENTHNGAIILLHPTSETNVKILPTLIDKWREEGYSLGTLDELTKDG